MVAGVADKTYTGFEITQDITVKDGDAVLTEEQITLSTMRITSMHRPQIQRLQL